MPLYISCKVVIYRRSFLFWHSLLPIFPLKDLICNLRPSIDSSYEGIGICGQLLLTLVDKPFG